MGIHMLKIRRSWDRLIFNMWIPILVRRHLYIETAPWSRSYLWHSTILKCRDCASAVHGHIQMPWHLTALSHQETKSLIRGFACFVVDRWWFEGSPSTLVSVSVSCLQTQADANTRGVFRVSHILRDCGPLEYRITDRIVFFYKENGTAVTISVYYDLSAVINTNVYNDLKVMWSNDYVMAQQVTSLFIMIQAPGIMILYDGNCRIYIQLEPIYANKVSRNIPRA